jgi:PAS domain S-box-containing protein
MPNTSYFISNRAVPARLAAAVTMLFGVAGLVGWTFHVQAFTSMLPGAVEMKANTALSLLLCGTALFVLTLPDSRNGRLGARWMAAITIVIASATFAEYAFDWRLGLDELLFKDSVGAFAFFRGRMSPLSAIALIAIGIALLGMTTRSWQSTAKISATLGASIGLVSLIGYMWNANELTTDRWLPPVAINTALCFAFLGGGILAVPKKARPDEGRTVTLTAVELKILAGFLVAFALLLFGGSYTYHNSVEFADAVEWIAHTQEVRAAVADLYGSAAGAEVAERDYFLTKAPEPLDEYRRLVDRVRHDLRQLAGLIADNPEQHRNFLSTQTVVDARLRTLDSALTAFDTYGLPATRAVLALSRHIATVENVHAATVAMDAVEVKLLQSRQASTARVRFSTLISLLVTLAAASALFYAFFRGIHREMLARRAAEQALRDSDQYNRSVIESSPDCVAILTTDAHITQITPQGMKLLDIEDFATVAGTDWCSFWSGEHRDEARAAVASAGDGNAARFEGYSATRRGVPKWWDVIVMPVRSATGQPERLIAVARDITEVKRTATNLLAANRFLDSLIENLPAMVVVKDAVTLKFVRVNKSFEDLIGITKSQLLGKGAHELFNAAEADYVVSKDREALAQGSLVDIPRQSIHTAHLGLRTFHTMKMPIGDDNGRPEYLLAISFDITERELAEEAIRELNGALQTKAAQLESTNKELESFSYSVSHDLRAPLRAIDGFAEIIEEDYKGKLDAEGRRYLSVIRQNSKRMGALIDDLLEFSRLGRQTVTNDEVNVDSLVREVVQDVLGAERSQAIGGDHVLPTIEIGPLPPTRGDRGLLRQVWVNLISNAVKYSSKSKQPVISVSGSKLDAENQYSVRDNGVGFNMDYVEKLFGVFQRLHRNDEFSGTGVGLAIVHRVVTRHGGRVWAEGRVNGGAVFTFALPTEHQNG